MANEAVGAMARSVLPVDPAPAPARGDACSAQLGSEVEIVSVPDSEPLSDTPQQEQEAEQKPHEGQREVGQDHHQDRDAHSPCGHSAGGSTDPSLAETVSDTSMLSSPPPSSVPSTPKDAIITPPYSSSGNKSPPLHDRDHSNVKFRKKRSFGARRRGVPSALNLEALNRERQFSGPFSANPLLRSYGDNKSSGAVAKPKHVEKQLTPKEPGILNRGVPAQTKPITLPLISELMNGAFLSPSRSAAPMSIDSPSLGHTTRDHPAAYISPKRPRLESGWMFNNSSKERFLKLCSEAWDLLRSNDA